jgi:hypothetical protein
VAAAPPPPPAPPAPAAAWAPGPAAERTGPLIPVDAADLPEPENTLPGPVPIAVSVPAALNRPPGAGAGDDSAAFLPGLRPDETSFIRSPLASLAPPPRAPAPPAPLDPSELPEPPRAAPPPAAARAWAPAPLPPPDPPTTPAEPVATPLQIAPPRAAPSPLSVVAPVDEGREPPPPPEPASPTNAAGMGVLLAVAAAAAVVVLSCAGGALWWSRGEAPPAAADLAAADAAALADEAPAAPTADEGPAAVIAAEEAPTDQGSAAEALAAEDPDADAPAAEDPDADAPDAGAPNEARPDDADAGPPPSTARRSASEDGVAEAVPAPRAAASRPPEPAPTAAAARADSAASRSRVEPEPTAEPVQPGAVDIDRLGRTAAKGKLSPSEVMELETIGRADDRFTRSRTILAMDARQKRSTSGEKRYLDELLSLPENKYNPLVLIDVARFDLNAKQYGRALERATLAERHWQRIPPELMADKKAQIYELEAKASKGLMHTAADEARQRELCLQAIRYWQRYAQQVAGRADLVELANRELAALEDIRKRLD